MLWWCWFYYLDYLSRTVLFYSRVYCMHMDFHMTSDCAVINIWSFELYWCLYPTQLGTVGFSHTLVFKRTFERVLRFVCLSPEVWRADVGFHFQHMYRVRCHVCIVCVRRDVLISSYEKVRHSLLYRRIRQARRGVRLFVFLARIRRVKRDLRCYLASIRGVRRVCRMRFSLCVCVPSALPEDVAEN